MDADMDLAAKPYALPLRPMRQHLDVCFRSDMVFHRAPALARLHALAMTLIRLRPHHGDAVGRIHLFRFGHASSCIDDFGTRFSPVSVSKEFGWPNVHVPGPINSVACGNVFPVRTFVALKIAHDVFVSFAALHRCPIAAGTYHRPSRHLGCPLRRDRPGFRFHCGRRFETGVRTQLTAIYRDWPTVLIYSTNQHQFVAMSNNVRSPCTILPMLPAMYCRG